MPFSDPMADGVTIQRSSQHAIEHGVSLAWILDELARRDFELDGARAADELSESAARVRLRRARGRARPRSASAASSCPTCRTRRARRCARRSTRGLGARAARDARDAAASACKTLCAASQGFVYAVTRPASRAASDAAARHGEVPRGRQSRVAAAGLRGLRRAARGAGATLAQHADGVIVGSALVEVLERGEDPAQVPRGRYALDA